MFKTTEQFDGAAATTRSLLGYGVLAGAVYVVFGGVLGATREGFDFSKHALSLLMLGDYGWLQRLNLTVSGLMVVLAAAGVRRADADPRVRKAGVLIAGYGVCLFGSAVFRPDPMRGFPRGSAAATDEVSASGLLHLVVGAIGFALVVAAAVTISRWHRAEGRSREGAHSRVAAGAVLIGFVAGAALSQSTIGIVLLWVAVVAAWVWLGAVSIDLYRRVPHPVIMQRAARG